MALSISFLLLDSVFKAVMFSPSNVSESTVGSAGLDFIKECVKTLLTRFQAVLLHIYRLLCVQSKIFDVLFVHLLSLC